MKTGLMSYDKREAPAWYHCTSCSRKNVKLWRAYMISCVELKCASCMGVDTNYLSPQGSKYNQIGEITFEIVPGMIPAIPDEDGTWWGHLSVPQKGFAWWAALLNN